MIAITTQDMAFLALLSCIGCSSNEPPSATQPAIDLNYGLAESKIVTLNDTELTYIEHGAGSPVLLVHGQLFDFRFGKAFIEDASNRHRVIAYSRRYFFPNPTSRELPQFRGPTDVADLIAFIEALDIAPVHLVGHSAGGHAALIVAVQRPDLVRSLVLAEGGFLKLPGIANRGVRASGAARALLEAGKDEQAVRTFVDAVGGQGSFDGMPAAVRRMNLDNRMALGLPLSPPPSCADVGALGTPTLIVRAESSPAFLGTLMDALKECMPSAEDVVIPHASHAMFLDNPPAFNVAVLRFLADNDR